MFYISTAISCFFSASIIFIFRIADKRYKLKDTKKILGWIIDVLKPWSKYIILLTVLLTLNTVFSLAGSVYLRTLMDESASVNQSSFMQTAVKIVILVVLEVASMALYNYYCNWTAYRVRQDLQYRMLHSLINKDYSSIRSKHTGEWMNRIVSDVQGIADGITAFFPVMISILIRFIGVTWLLCQVSVYFIPVFLLGFVGIFCLNLLMREPMKQRHREAREANGKVRIYFTDIISQILVVKAFNHEELAAAGSEALLENEFHYSMRRQVLQVAKRIIQTAGTKLGYIAFIIYGVFSVLRGRISYGSLAMAARLLSQIREPITMFSDQIKSFPDYIVPAERLREVETYPDDPDCPVKSDAEIQSWYHDSMSEIILRDAAFTYGDENDPEGERKVLSDINLRIPKKSTTAITGRTGSGKSTLFKLLMSLYPLNSGSKTLGTIDGGETDLDASFRRLFAYVPQGSQLLTGTVREIIAFGDKNDMQNEQKIQEALEISCALEFVEKLPHGLDTQIKEKGSNLSEGQMQRLAIARAVFSERPILLLDEATSSLDEPTERQVLDNMRAMTDRTILIVTHRPAALSICEQEIHIDDGKLSVKKLTETGAQPMFKV